MGDQVLERFRTTLLELLSDGLPEDRGHAISTHEWLLCLEPTADRALQAAALGHDVERAVSPRVSRRKEESLEEYKARHALRSSQLIRPLLDAAGFVPAEVERVAQLIASHESENAHAGLRDADLISFFSHNLAFFYASRGEDAARTRIRENLESASSRVRLRVEALSLDPHLAVLVREELQRA